MLELTRLNGTHAQTIQTMQTIWNEQRSDRNQALAKSLALPSSHETHYSHTTSITIYYNVSQKFTEANDKYDNRSFRKKFMCMDVHGA